ncbi:hypothetical protein CUU66_12450 [Peribacillus deserti]|uniref:Uncharacterized protein n=1 Tax=Peribacillus deserti TaxID=673318 RepID=A0A2N5M581_9BACI|nr:hypothetical protein CUU66_12450 [Peribacillus deserti]
MVRHMFSIIIYHDIKTKASFKTRLERVYYKNGNNVEMIEAGRNDVFLPLKGYAGIIIIWVWGNFCSKPLSINQIHVIYRYSKHPLILWGMNIFCRAF